MPENNNPDAKYAQELSPEEVEFLQGELRRIELNDKLVQANIKAKTESGYFEAVARNGWVSNWRKVDRAGYRVFRRNRREAEAEKEGRKLRAYKPFTPERRAEQLRTSKQEARKDPDYAAAERAKNTAARAAKRALMTPEERDDANRIRREKRAAKKNATIAT